MGPGLTVRLIPSLLQVQQPLLQEMRDVKVAAKQLKP